jgi:predicted nucleic acid-binding protein
VKRWLVDTGVLYALADRDDEWHERAASCRPVFGVDY